MFHVEHFIFYQVYFVNKDYVLCALGETRTLNPVKELAPKASAYTSFATKANLLLYY